MRPGLWFFDTHRIYVPAIPELRLDLLELFHNPLSSGHQGCRRSLDKIAPRFYWPSLHSDFSAFVAHCDQCQRNKQPNHPPAGYLHPLPVPNSRFEDVNFDFFSLPKSAKGYDMVLGIICRLTKLIRLIPCHRTATATEVAKLFLQHWVMLGRPLPRSFTSDRDSLFHSTFFQSLCKELGIHANFTTARHQQANGQIERTFNTLATTLRKYTNYASDNWCKQLPHIEFALNNSTNQSTGYTPFWLAFGINPILIPTAADITQRHEDDITGDFLTNLNHHLNRAKSNIESAQDQQAMHYNKHRTSPPTYVPGDWVLLQRDGINLPADANRPEKLLSPWIGPFRVSSVDLKQPLNVTLDLPHPLSIHPTFSVAKLRPYIHSRPPPSNTSPNNSDAPGPVNDNNHFEVQQILDVRFQRSKHQFLIRWKGWQPDADSWEVLESLDCPLLMKRFLKLHPKHPVLLKHPLPSVSSR
jgi:hypothetical protein